MNDTARDRQLAELVQRIGSVLEAGLGIGPCEAQMFAVVDLLRAHPSLQPVFAAGVGELLALPDPGGAPSHLPAPELVELVVHELRLAPLIALAEARVARLRAIRAGFERADAATHIVAAAADDWEDRYFFVRYRDASGR